MISFNYEIEFALEDENRLEKWIESVILNHGYTLGEVNYIFCDDVYLHKLNVEFLQHDTLTDVISFDNTVGKNINGDIFISIDRVKENASDFNVLFEEELQRVMIHGVLHYLGYKDKTPQDESEMRHQEDNALILLSN